MNIFCQGIFNQMDMGVDSILKLLSKLNEEDLSFRPTAGKMSIGELLVHTSVLCKADFLIGVGASEEEMNSFYELTEPDANLSAIADALVDNYAFLKAEIALLGEEELLRETKSYWGAVHTRFEWLAETHAHLYHHRGQLHAMLVHALNRDPKVPLFE